MIENNILYLDGKSLTIQEVYTAATVPLKVKLRDDSRLAIKNCREKLIRQIKEQSRTKNLWR
jgi:histidine ammonia-lyase